MNSFRRPVLSSAIPSHCVSTASPASGSSAHTSATLRAEKKRRVESRSLQNRHRAVLHHTKLLAAARPQLEAALSSHSESVRGASPARVYESPPAEADGVELELPPRGTITGSKRPVDYPWDWVSPQLLNRKGEEIYYPVVDDADRAWARRLEWAINHHRDLAQSDLNGLQAECERVLRRSQSAAVRRDERYYIKSLQSQLEDAHKRLRDAHT